MGKGTTAIRYGAAPEGRQVNDYIFSQRSRPPSQLPTRHKLVSSTSWTPQSGHTNNGQATSRTTGTRLKPAEEGGATSKGGKGNNESNFMDSKSVGERIRFPRVA